MVDIVNIRCGRVYQHNKTRNRDSSVRSPQSVKIDLIFFKRPRILIERAEIGVVEFFRELNDGESLKPGLRHFCN